MIQKGSRVRILRPESYWFQKEGRVVMIDKNAKNPYIVRFESLNYSGLNSNNFAESELSEVAPPPTTTTKG